MVGWQLTIGGQNGDSQGQVKATAFLAEVGRCHVYGDVCPWETHVVVLNGRRDAVAPFAYGLVTKASEVVQHALHEVHLHGNGGYVQPVYRCTVGFDKHR